MMRVLVTGATGQLGSDLMKELTHRGMEAIGVGSKEMDITELASVQRVMRACVPDAVIHCAGYTAVDAAEDEPELCHKVNVDGTRHVAAVCKELGCKLLHISTDYVFLGDGVKPWSTEDTPNPINVYGRSKYESELVVQEQLEHYFIVRISWVFGIHGTNFVKTILSLAKNRDSLMIVNDQVGSPTYTVDLAVLLADMIQTEEYGIYHATSEGECSWYEFACEILRMAGRTIPLTPVTSDQYRTKAVRPKNSRMNKDKLTEKGFQRLPHWKSGLERFLSTLEAEE